MSNPVYNLLGVPFFKQAERRLWYVQFWGMPDHHRQPWLDMVVDYLRENPEKFTTLKKLPWEDQNRAWKIMAAVLWNRDYRVDRGELMAVKTEDPPGTGYINPEEEQPIVVVFAE